MVYQDITKVKNKYKTNPIENRPNIQSHHVRRNQKHTNQNNEDIADNKFLNELKNMFTELLNKNNIILTKLTTIINK